MKKRELFPVVEAPQFGWQRMQARMQQRRAPLWWAAAAGAVAVAVLLVVFSPRGAAVDLMPEARASAAAGVLGLEQPLIEPVELRGEGSGLLRLASSDPGVLMYRLAVLEAPAAGRLALDQESHF